MMSHRRTSKTLRCGRITADGSHAKLSIVSYSIMRTRVPKECSSFTLIRAAKPSAFHALQLQILLQTLRMKSLMTLCILLELLVSSCWPPHAKEPYEGKKANEVYPMLISVATI
jgi:hypothetical protein